MSKWQEKKNPLVFAKLLYGKTKSSVPFTISGCIYLTPAKPTLKQLGFMQNMISSCYVCEMDAGYNLSLD